MKGFKCKSAPLCTLTDTEFYVGLVQSYYLISNLHHYCECWNISLSDVVDKISSDLRNDIILFMEHHTLPSNFVFTDMDQVPGSIDVLCFDNNDGLPF